MFPSHACIAGDGRIKFVEILYMGQILPSIPDEIHHESRPDEETLSGDDDIDEFLPLSVRLLSIHIIFTPHATF